MATIAGQPTVLLGYFCLLMHDLVFILPLAVLLIASSHPTLVRLGRRNPHHKDWLRLVLRGGFAMGLLILATV